MREVSLDPSSEGLFPDSKSDGGLSDTTLCGSLWDQAILRLDRKKQAIISELKSDTCKPGELLGEVNREIVKCQAKQWHTTCHGRRIFLRDVLSRIAGFLQKITSVMDALVQYDPGHLSIPWAFARFLLVAAVSDINTYGAFLESMEKVTDIISRYAIIESIYLQPDLDCSSRLESAVVSVYTAILHYICKAKLYFGHNTMVRIGISVLKVEQDASKLMEAISSGEETVEKWMVVNRSQLGFRTSVGVSELNGAFGDFRKESDERALRLQATLVEMQKPVSRMANQIDYIHSSIEGSERARIIKWISSLGKDYEKNHSTKARYRLKNSGEWLLRTQKYRHWLKNSSCSILWLYGGAGYGKSFLVSLVVDEMIEERKQNPLAANLAYFYCTRDTAEPKRANPTEILRSIVRQLSCLNSQTPIRKPVINKWNERVEGESDHGLEVEECIDLLLDLTRDNPAVICIDALDECDLGTRKQLLDAIGKVIDYSEQIVKVFVSSRREADFLDYFDKWEALEISAKDNREDIENFIDDELRKSTKDKTLLNGKASDKLLSDIRGKLLDRADGMFRWVSACLQTLCDPIIVMEAEVRDALGKLPDELKDVYDIICSQIQRRKDKGKALAENVLVWLLYANKPLSCHEMIRAATTDTKATATKEDVLSLCCNFVKVDEEIGVFQFVHLSVREYLEERPEYEAALSHATIAESCLQTCLTNMKPKRRANLQNLQNKTFYDYAQVYWPLHCQMAKQYRRKAPLETSFRKFLCNGRFPTKQFHEWVNRWTESWSQMELETRRGAEMGMREKLNECMDIYRHGNPIFAACVFGFTEIIDNRREAGMAGKDSTWRNGPGRDPYELAIRYGQEDVINILRSTTSLDSATARESALLSAVSLGEMQMVTMLLNDHPDLEITEETMTAAAANCDLEMMKFLAERYLDFKPTILNVLTAASNESHGQDIVRFLFDEGAEDIEDFDMATLLCTACSNGPCGLEIVQFIIDNADEISVSEDTMKAAAQNDIDAYQILRALLKLDKNITITEEITEAAARNPSPEPMRLLVSRFPSSVRVTWTILNEAARNADCGHTIMTILLAHSKEALADEDLLLAAVSNEKLAVKLLEVLLPKALASRVTNDVLKRAAVNKFFGHRLVELLLGHAPGLRLESALFETASRNLYYAPEVLQLLLDYDSNAVITTVSLEEAAENKECGVEALEILFTHQEAISQSDRSLSDTFTHRKTNSTQGLQEALTIPPEVVEAAASNAESGTDVMALLLKWDQHVVITHRAVENAAGNADLGEEIIALWTTHKRTFEISPHAIERAAGNHNIGWKVLNLLLRLDKRVVITDEALEIAASNPYYGLQMVKAMMIRWKVSDGWEEIVSRAARNAQNGHQILAYLLKQEKGSITSDIIEACAGSPFADKEMIAILLNAAPGIVLGLETVEAASNRPQHFFDILGVLRAHDPNVPISEAAMHNFIRMSFDVIETMRLLNKFQSQLKITEGMLKSVARNINANEATITYLCGFQKQQSSTGGTLPVTEEVLLAGLQNSGNGAVSMVKMLLALQPIEAWVAEEDDKRLEAAVRSYRAEAMLPVLIRHYQRHHRVLRVTPKALEKAASNFVVLTSLKTLLKLVPESDKDIITTPEIIHAAAGNRWSTSQLKFLIANAASRNLDLRIDQAVFETAMLGPAGTGKMILRLWATKGQSGLIKSCITEKVLEIAASYIRFIGSTVSPEQSIFHFLFRMRAEQGVRIHVTESIVEKALTRGNIFQAGCRNSRLIEYFRRILRRQGCDTKFEDLITTKTLKLASCSMSEHLVSQFLEMLPEERREQLLTQDVLLAAAGSGYNDSLNFLLKKKKAFQQYKQYYDDISKFHKASWSIYTGKERQLLRRQCWPNAPMLANGRSMLSVSAGYNELPSVRTFMRFPGFDLDATDFEGDTALHLASERGAMAVVELLLARGANTKVKNNDGKMPEDVARDKYHYMVGRKLRDHDAAK